MSKNKKFYSFVIPAIGGMVVTGLYFIVDAIFVGRGVGTDALAMINLAVPFIALLTSITLMITLGGATITSIYFGKGEDKKANNTFNTSILLVLIFALFMTIIATVFPTQIARLLGASDLLVEGTAVYMRYYVMFGIFFSGSMSLSAFVRNDGNPKLAFWGMVTGALSNIFLDWLFIFPFQMGVMGAAVASGLGQVFSCALLLTHFIKRKGKLRISKPIKESGLIKRIFKVGAPEFITNMNQPITILCYNLIVLKVFGEIGVAAFSVISTLALLIIYVFNGVAQGIQPLISISYGQGDTEKEAFFFNKGLKLSIVLSVIIYLIMIIWGENIISLFSSDYELIKIAYNCILVYGIAFIFASANIIFTTYHLATERTKKALCITSLRSVVLNVICIFIVPILLGDSFVWSGIILAELLVTVIALAITRNKESIYQNA